MLQEQDMAFGFKENRYGMYFCEKKYFEQDASKIPTSRCISYANFGTNCLCSISQLCRGTSLMRTDVVYTSPIRLHNLTQADNMFTRSD
jgi:hypothetical protein